MRSLSWLFSLFILLFSSFLEARELGVATMFRNEGPFLREWIEYHRMVGVEHFWMYNDNSTDNWQEVLDPYIKEGLVEVFYWPVSSRAAYTGRQCEAFRDALKRALGNTKWMSCIDIDEFILPMKGKTIPDCLTTYFPQAVAVYANWRNFGTGGVAVPLEEPFLMKLTGCSFKGHPKNNSGKSIVQPEYVLIDDIWYAHHFPLKPGYSYVNGDGKMIEHAGDNMQTDGKHHDKYIRINHYVLRDENFYQNVRLARAKQGYGDGGLPLLLEHYEMFSKLQDTVMPNFIRKNHPRQYERMWKKYDTK